MKTDYSAFELQQLTEQLQHVFETVQALPVEELPEPEAPAADGLRVSYEVRGSSVCTVIARSITVEGTPFVLRMESCLSEGAAESTVSLREARLYHDDMVHDFLTGAYNRRYWETVFACKLFAFTEAARPVAVALVSVDGLENIVRTHGQPSADQLVCFVANQWKKYYDEGDEKLVARLTGGTFAVGCVGAEETDLENQMRVLYGRLNRVCTSTCGMMTRIPFTLSIACAGTDELDVPEWEKLYSLADTRLRGVQDAGGDAVAKK